MPREDILIEVLKSNKVIYGRKKNLDVLSNQSDQDHYKTMNDQIEALYQHQFREIRRRSKKQEMYLSSPSELLPLLVLLLLVLLLQETCEVLKCREAMMHSPLTFQHKDAKEKNHEVEVEFPV